MPTKLPESLVVPKNIQLTHREAKFLAARIEGLNEPDSMRKAGFADWLCRRPASLNTMPRLREIFDTYQSKLAKHTLEEGLIDSVEIHEYLTEALRADMRDIRNDDGSFKPQSEWPPIWGRMMEAGDCEIEKTFVRSADGKDEDKRGGWDESGRVTKVKLKFSSKVKLMELAMRHKGVNAMVQEKQGDLHVHLHGEITAKLQAAQQRKAQLDEARNVTP